MNTMIDYLAYKKPIKVNRRGVSSEPSREFVGRSKDLALVDRNKDIVQMVSKGYSYQAVADTFGLTKQRIAQICSESHESITDDSYRDLMRTELEGLSEDLFRLWRGPGPLVISPGGSIVCEYGPDGKPDHSRPVHDEYAKVKVAETLLKTIERRAKLYGIDRMKQRTQDQTAEVAEFMAWVQQLDAEKKALEARLTRYEEEPEVVQAEIVS